MFSDFRSKGSLSRASLSLSRFSRTVDRFATITPWLRASYCGLWEPFLELGTPMQVKAGEIILNPGDDVQGLYLLSRGWVKVTAHARKGLKRTFLAVCAESVIGGMALFSRKRQQNIVQAISECQIYFFEERLVLETIMANKPLAIWVFNDFALKVEAVLAQLQSTTFYSINTRVSLFIYLYTLDHGQADSLGGYWVAMSHSELAECLGAHRVTISNAIRNLKQLGLLRTSPKRINVPDMEALRAHLLNVL